MDNVVKLKPGKLSRPNKIRLTNIKSSPTVEMTVAENIVIQKFIKFAIKDLEFQKENFMKQRFTPEELEHKLQASNFLIEYYKITLFEIEKGIF